MQLVYGVILLSKILRNHLLSKNMQWSYASFNVSFNYPMYGIMEFCVATDNWAQKYCQTLGSKPNHFTPCAMKTIIFQRENLNYSIVCFTQYPVFQKSLFSITDLFAVRYLWVVCNEDKCCVETQRAADIRVAWLVTFARIACPLQLWIKTSEPDYSIWVTPRW